MASLKDLIRRRNPLRKKKADTNVRRENIEARRKRLRRERDDFTRRLDRLGEILLEAEASDDPRVPRIREHIAELEGERAEVELRLVKTRKKLEQADELWKSLKARLVRLGKRIKRKRRAETTVGKVYSRSEWGAASPRGGYARNPRVTRRVMHHTAYPALSPNASVAQEAAKMRAIQQGHFSRGFTDIGYHAVVFPSGRIWLARPEWAIGAHVLNFNTGSVGVSADGNYEVSTPTPALIAAARRAFEGLPGSSAGLVGHYQLNPTACPGRNLKPKLDDIS